MTFRLLCVPIARRGNSKQKRLLHPSFNKRDGTLQHYFRPAAQNDQGMFPNLHAARLCCRRVTFLLLTGLIAGRRGYLQDKNVWRNPSFNKSEVVLCKTISCNQKGPIAMEWPLTCCWPVLQEQEDHFPSPVRAHCQTRKLKTEAASAPFVQRKGWHSATLFQTRCAERPANVPELTCCPPVLQEGHFPSPDRAHRRSSRVPAVQECLAEP